MWMISRITGGSVFCHFCPSKMKVFFFWGCRITSISPPQKKLIGSFDGWLLATGNHQGRIQQFVVSEWFLPKWAFIEMGETWWKHDNSTKNQKKHHEITWCDSPWFSYDSVALRRRYLLVSGPEGLGQPRFHAWSVALPRTRMKFHVSVSCHKNTTFDIYIYIYIGPGLLQKW